MALPWIIVYYMDIDLAGLSWNFSLSHPVIFG